MKNGKRKANKSKPPGRGPKPGTRGVIEDTYALQLLAQNRSGATRREQRAAQDMLLRAGRHAVAPTVALVQKAHEASPGCRVRGPAEVLRLAEEVEAHQRAAWAGSSRREMTLCMLRALRAGLGLWATKQRAKLVLARVRCVRGLAGRDVV